METPTWIAAIATAAYALTFLVAAIYGFFQYKELKLQGKAEALKEVYKHVMDTHDDRAVVYAHADQIKRIRSDDDLARFAAARPEVEKAIHAVSNCYHYVGFLAHCKALPSTDEFLDEGGHTLVAMDDIIGGYVGLTRRKLGRDGYKRHYSQLVEAARSRLEGEGA